MPVARKKRLVIIERRQKVAELYVQSWTQMAIASELEIAQATVSTDLKAIRKEWRESAIRDFDAVRAIELRKLERLERESWSAWQRSQEPAEATKIVTDGEGRKAEKSVKQQTGDPRFLDQIHKCIASRRAMLGLDAPQRIAPTTPDGEPLSLDQRQIHIMAVVAERFGNDCATEEVTPDDAQTITASLAGPVGRGIDPVEPVAPLGQDATGAILPAFPVSQTANVSRS